MKNSDLFETTMEKILLLRWSVYWTEGSPASFTIFSLRGGSIFLSLDSDLALLDQESTTKLK